MRPMRHTVCQKNLPFFVSIVYGAIHSTFFMYSCEKKTPQPIKTTYRYELLLTQSYRPCPFREESHPLQIGAYVFVSRILTRTCQLRIPTTTKIKRKTVTI